MNFDFYKSKIQELSDEKLKELLQIANNPSNKNIFELAKAEAEKRKISLETITTYPQPVDSKNLDAKILKKWNWGAFVLSVIWTLAHRLEKWTILCFIPIVNIYAVFYLGFNGNRLAFEKSNISSPEEFMKLQARWSIWAFRIICVGIFIGILSLFI